jgi:phage shock protein A
MSTLSEVLVLREQYKEVLLEIDMLIMDSSIRAAAEREKLPRDISWVRREARLALLNDKIDDARRFIEQLKDYESRLQSLKNSKV